MLAGLGPAHPTPKSCHSKHNGSAEPKPKGLIILYPRSRWRSSALVPAPVPRRYPGIVFVFKRREALATWPAFATRQAVAISPRWLAHAALPRIRHRALD